MAQGSGGSGPGPCRRAVVRLVRGCESWTADAAEGAIGVDAARVDAERGGCLRLVTLIDVWGRGVQAAWLLRAGDPGTHLSVP